MKMNFTENEITRFKNALSLTSTCLGKHLAETLNLSAAVL